MFLLYIVVNNFPTFLELGEFLATVTAECSLFCMPIYIYIFIAGGWMRRRRRRRASVLFSIVVACSICSM